MAKFVRCRNAGMDCDYFAKADTEDELLQQMGQHLKDVHNIDLDDLRNTAGSAMEDI